METGSFYFISNFDPQECTEKPTIHFPVLPESRSVWVQSERHWSNQSPLHQHTWEGLTIPRARKAPCPSSTSAGLTVQLVSQPAPGPQIATERPLVPPLVFSCSVAGSSFLHTVPQMVSSGGRKWWDTNCAVPNSNQSKHLALTGREPPRPHR